MSAHKITSEIYIENGCVAGEPENDVKISEFFFEFPPYTLGRDARGAELRYDDDGDLILTRKQKKKEGKLAIEHRISTELSLVGLQVWRGAFLLADYILSNPQSFKQKRVLELGSGVGLTSIVASFLASEVICTDTDVEEILKLIRRNFARNQSYVSSKVSVEGLNFLCPNWPRELQRKIDPVDIVLAADVIYDDDITEGFVGTLERLFNSGFPKVAYVALEKRYVFTVADLDSVAPMYEEFLRCVRRRNHNWNIEHVATDFPQYFRYDRVDRLILMKIQKGTPTRK
ncbi:methyltransferase-like protein 22 isoform X2 [Orussus abietinus]|nr:methyltransferase-like protein 22 isoform X2 [Orussus abietinus]XP_012274372.1 methyltransferase-like protein 22 isoform X2 [Orussus abietinus]XP_023290212.1 methyltransferase-like protein 22 isoform X2 [Orussus abietinus]